LAIIRMRISIARLLFLVFLAAMTSACTIHANIPNNYDVTYPKDTEKIPLRIGLCLDSSIDNIDLPSTPRGGLVVHMNDSLTRNAELMVKRMSNIVIVDKRNVTNMPCDLKSVDVIITPVVTSMRLHLLQENFNQVLDFMISIKWSVVDSGGKTLYVNTFIGQHSCEPYRPLFGGKEMAKECVQRAVEGHFRKAYEGIMTTKWWSQAIK